MAGKGRKLPLYRHRDERRSSFVGGRALVEKDLLTNAEVRAVLMMAANDLGQHEYAEPMTGAAGIIGDDPLPQFPDAGGD